MSLFNGKDGRVKLFADLGLSQSASPEALERLDKTAEAINGRKIEGPDYDHVAKKFADSLRKALKEMVLEEVEKMRSPQTVAGLDTVADAINGKKMEGPNYNYVAKKFADSLRKAMKDIILEEVGKLPIPKVEVNASKPIVNLSVPQPRDPKPMNVTLHTPREKRRIKFTFDEAGEVDGAIIISED